MNKEILKISSNTNAGKVAGALAAIARRGEATEIQAIGPKAVSQAVKAVAIARKYVADADVDLVITPAFCDVEVESGEIRTAMVMIVENR